jgi:hypothetical protein
MITPGGWATFVGQPAIASEHLQTGTSALPGQQGDRVLLGGLTRLRCGDVP